MVGVRLVCLPVAASAFHWLALSSPRPNLPGVAVSMCCRVQIRGRADAAPERDGRDARAELELSPGAPSTGRPSIAGPLREIIVWGIG